MYSFVVTNGAVLVSTGLCLTYTAVDWWPNHQKKINGNNRAQSLAFAA